MDRIMTCGASFLRERDAGEVETASLRASRKRGDRIHECLRKGNPAGLSFSDNKLYERIAFKEAEMVNQHSFEGSQEIRETRFWYQEGEIGEEINWVFSAKPDVVHLLNGRGMVINYKTGETVPSALPMNYQLISECALVCFHYHLYEVVGVLSHPKVQDRQRGPDHQFYTYSAHRLLGEFMPKIIQRSRYALDPLAKAVPGNSQCEYCNAAKINACPERRNRN